MQLWFVWKKTISAWAMKLYKSSTRCHLISKNQFDCGDLISAIFPVFLFLPEILLWTWTIIKLNLIYENSISSVQFWINSNKLYCMPVYCTKFKLIAEIMNLLCQKFWHRTRLKLSFTTFNFPSSFIETKPFWRKRRYLVVLLAFFGFFNVYALRVNLSVAIVAMTEVREVQQQNGTITTEQYFHWDSSTRGIILSSFFYGYITTQFIGGYFSQRIGGNLIFGVGIGMTALLTLLTPLAAKMGVGVLIAVRIIEGVFEGVTFPCIHAVWWVVEQIDRFRLIFTRAD